MNTVTVSSVDNLVQTLADATERCVRIKRSASDDVAPALITHAEQRIAHKTRALIVCADTTALDHFRRIAGTNSCAYDSIVSLRDLCLGILADPAVEQAIGRRARVLSENEHDVLMEDMKASGLKPRRLREMLKFFYKTISECGHEQPHWLLTSEEQMVFAVLEENLSFRRALLACELPFLAARGLALGTSPYKAEPLTVIVDDFGSLSLASQRLLKQLAQNGLIVSGSDLLAENGEELYPNHEGFSSFCTAHPDALSIELALPAAEVATTYTVYDDSAAELHAVPRTVSAAIEAGLQPCDIIVATPNDFWAKSISEDLKLQGITTLKLAASDKIKGDPRKPGHFANLKLATFLKLYDNPQDLVSLRSWIGFGDWLMGSDAILELMAYASENNLDAEQAIITLRAMPDNERPVTLFKKLDHPLDELEAILQATADISIERAIALFEEHDMPLDARLIALLGEDEGRADFANLARRAFAPQQTDPYATNAVLVAPYKQCHGRHVHTVLLSGLANGFLPSIDAVDDTYTIDHRAMAIVRERAIFDDVVTAANGALTCSLFAVDTLERAAVLKVQTSRIFIKNDRQYAKIAPSEFIPTSN